MEKLSPLPEAPRTNRARELLLSTTVLWGLSFPLVRGLELAQKGVMPSISDEALVCADMTIRFGFAALLFLPFYARHLTSITAREWSQSLGLAGFAGAGLYLQTLGLSWTDASVSAFLTQLYTLIVPLIVALRDRRMPSARVVMACGLVLAGVALLSPNFLAHFTLGPGEIITALGAGFFACQIVWVERPIYAENRSGLVTLLMFSLLGIMFSIAYLSTGSPLSKVPFLFGTPILWELILAVVLLCTVFTFYVMNRWQHHVTATEAGLIYCLEPVFATVISSFLPGWISAQAGISYPNEILRWTLLVGGLFIVAATLLVATEKRPTSPAS